MTERDYWRGEYERVAGERAHLVSFLGNLAEALSEGDYVSVAEINGGPAVNITARYSSLYAVLKAAEGLQTLRRIFQLARLAAATGFRDLKIEIDLSR